MAGSCAGEATALGGASGWYAPLMNILRAPFTGRNGEYYSEDGFLSGTIGLLEVCGATNKGLYATIKQAVMSAFNRIGATWTGGNYALLTSVLHNEWGFRGWIVTDSASSAGSYMDVSQMIEAGGVSKLAQAENLAKSARLALRFGATTSGVAPRGLSRSKPRRVRSTATSLAVGRDLAVGSRLFCGPNAQK